jgi:preprotein translocase subunit SecA
MISTILTRIFGSRNERLLKEYAGAVRQINALEPAISALSDEALMAKTAEFKERVAKGEELDAILPEAFAVVREAGKRALQMRHFDVQLLGGIALHNGKIAEMRTGEGKTLVATLPAYLNALTGKGVHIVTVNDTSRSAMRTGWGASTARSASPSASTSRRWIMRRSRPLCRRHHLRYQQRVRLRLPARQHGVRGVAARAARTPVRDRHEVDSILIDEARTPLIISGRPRTTSISTTGSDLAPKLTRQADEGPGDYWVDERPAGAALRGGSRARRGDPAAAGSCS